MTFLQFLRIFWARKWMILVPTVVCFLTAAVVASLLPRRYEGSARVLLDTQTSDALTGLNVSGREVVPFVRNQAEIIRSDQVAYRVVDSLGLASDPVLQARFAESGRGGGDGEAFRRWVAGEIRSNTSARGVAGSMLELRYLGQTPEFARIVADALREAYLVEALRLRTESATRSGEWYREQADRAQRLLLSAEEQRGQFLRDNNVVLTGGPGSTDVEMARLAALQASVQQARGQAGTQEVMASARLATDPVADQLRVQLAAVEDELARAGERLGPAHPEYRAIEARRNIARNQISRAQTSTQAGVAALTGASRTALSRLESDLARQEEVVVARRPVMDRLVQLDRAVEMARSQYESAVQRAEGFRMGADATLTGMVPVGEAVAPATPASPRPVRIVVLATAFGLALGLLSALLFEFLARRVRGPEDLAHATGAPVVVTLGSTPPSAWRERARRLLGRRRADDEGALQAI